MNKTIRKNLHLSQKDLNKFTDLSSFDFISETEKDSYCTTKLYKDRTSSCHVLLVHTRTGINSVSKNTVTYYFFSDEKLTTLHRFKMPAIIICEKGHNIELHYIDHSNLLKRVCYKRRDIDSPFKLTEFIYNNEKQGLFLYQERPFSSIILQFRDKNKITEYLFDGKSNVNHIEVANKDKKVLIQQYYDHSVAAPYIKTKRIQYFNKNALHNLNGPAVIKQKLAPKTKPITIEKDYYINNKKIPDNIIKPNFDPLTITKIDILDAMLFDREYGEYCVARKKSAKIQITLEQAS